MNLKQELEARGLLNQYSSEEVFNLYNKGGESFYIGFDPSSDSLQLGNMCAIIAAVNLMKYGNKCYFLVGGATGMIGDPGGKDVERNFLTEEILRYNEKAIYNQLKHLLDNIKNKTQINFDFELVNNYDFFKDMSVLDFLRNVGKYISINNMIKKETVAKRIEDPSKSISYTEFSYMLLQGYDFLKLFGEKNVKLQLSGGDQWGNAVTGIELIRKIEDSECFVITIPIITDASGKKFGKSAGNAIWLDPKKNSPYFVYQFLLNTSDTDIEKLLKVLTFSALEDISKVMEKHSKNPELRIGQKFLASQVTALIFGDDALNQAEIITNMLFGDINILEEIKGLGKSNIDALSKEVGSIKFERNVQILDALVNIGLTSSRGDGRKLIKCGSIFINEKKIENGLEEITSSDFINGVVIVRKGKKNYKLILN